MLPLDTRGLRVTIALGNPFFGGWRVIDAAGTTAEGHMPVVDDSVALHNRAVDIGGMNKFFVYMHHSRVIREDSALPHAAGKADAHVSKAVVHAAVVANVLAPIAIVEHELAAGPAPVARGPQRAGIGRRHPGAGNPVIAIGTVGPIARCPHQAGFGAQRLLIDRQHWRGKPHADKNSTERRQRD
jgi:hypothetical protein